MLGMPMRLASLLGSVSGISGFLLLLLVGWIIDRGSNPIRRKSIAMVFGAGCLLLGMSLVVVANTLHLVDLINYNGTLSPVDNHSYPWNIIVPADGLLLLENNRFGVPSIMSTSVKGDAGRDLFFTLDLIDSSMDGSFSEKGLKASVHKGTAGKSWMMNDSTELSLKAGLGLLAFILLDTGFDAINSFTRSFVLTCTPRSEHTSVLLVGLVMASAGGVSTAALGVVDFASLLGLSHIQG
ncbi:hypothetical protein V1264_024834 [Littorina saxatilis]|uniref:Uncharacterized protein n=1 Tax=Littorina saxatilis TaxID=31220 RepID=A0AAN9FZD8_9CAEN